MSRSLDMTPAGLPHSEIPGSKRACRSPRLIAACCVLHRLSVPRHPPSTLSNLTIKCLDLMRSAVACHLQILDNPTCLCISLIYNPYSIVNEPYDAVIGAAFHRGMARTADPCGAFDFRVRDSAQPEGRPMHFASTVWSLRVLGGADRVRTDDPLLAKQVLSQLSYSPG